MKRLALALAFCLLAGAVLAVGVDRDTLSDPAEEARARALSRDFRCLVCQNQSIEDSNADLAADLRHVVRERIRAGDTDDEVRAYLVARYGDWVLMKPPFNARTLLIWLGPLLGLVAAGGAVILYYRRMRGQAPEPLSAEEESRLKTLLEKGGGA